jgi:hypothetical protein
MSETSRTNDAAETAAKAAAAAALSAASTPDKRHEKPNPAVVEAHRQARANTRAVLGHLPTGSYGVGKGDT